jgi:phytoene dehydrogenase-like protein
VADAFDTVVIGGGTNGLAAAIRLAAGGGRVLLVEREETLGGTARELEFAPGFRAAPFGAEAGWIPPEVAKGVGLNGFPTVAVDPTVVAPAGDGSWLELRRDPAATAAGLRRFSARDAEQWPGFAARIHRIASFLGELYRLPAPDIDTTSLGEMWGLLQVGRKLRGLGATEMVEVLRTVPMAAAELLDDWFEHELLKGVLAAGAVIDIAQGPISGGTAFNLLHHLVGSPLGTFRARTLPAGGGAALVTRLADRARRAGVEIRTGAPVAAIMVGPDDAVAGVRLESGEEIASRQVLSTADPRRTLLELVDPVHLDPEFILAVRNVRFRGAASKILLGLDGLPEAPGLGPESLRGALSFSPSMVQLEKAYDAIKYGGWSPEPYVEARIPSLVQPDLAPAGQHVMVLHVQYAPYRLAGTTWDAARDPMADAAIAVVERHLPGFTRRIRHRAVLTPMDLEARFGLFEGAVTHGEMMLDQILFMRPVAGASRSAMPVPGLFLGGAGAHPGGGITGAAGWLAARAAREARR